MDATTTEIPTPTAPPPARVEWVVWHRADSSAKWQPVNVARSEKEAIGLISGKGDWFWAPKGFDPNRRRPK